MTCYPVTRQMNFYQQVKDHRTQLKWQQNKTRHESSQTFWATSSLRSAECFSVELERCSKAGTTSVCEWFRQEMAFRYHLLPAEVTFHVCLCVPLIAVLFPLARTLRNFCYNKFCM